jgi:hypothetical protein
LQSQFGIAQADPLLHRFERLCSRDRRYRDRASGSNEPRMTCGEAMTEPKEQQVRVSKLITGQAT